MPTVFPRFAGHVVSVLLFAGGAGGIGAPGRDESAGLYGALAAQFPGHGFRRSTEVDLHHDAARYGWELTAPDGTRVTDRTYRGKWLLVYFGYTSCPDSCPTTLFVMAETLRALGSDADDLQPLFITLDPQRDTPEVMDAYVRSFDPRIVGLTGEPRAVDAAAQAYGVYVARHEPGPNGRDGLVDHGTAIYLMSPQGRFVRAFDADWPGDRIAATLRALKAPQRDRASDEADVTGR